MGCGNHDIIWQLTAVSTSKLYLSVKWRRPSQIVTISIGRAGANKKSPIDELWKMLSQTLVRALSANL